MRHLAKFGILLLALLIGGVPVMACMLPSTALTAQEQACCRQNANQCGHNQMPSSHSCCKTVSPPDQSAVVNSWFKMGYHVQVLHFSQPTVQLAELPQRTFADFHAMGHSPRQAPPSSLNILRI